MTQAIAHTRPTRKTRARLSKVAPAADSIAGFDHGMDIVGLTFGQFSLLDLIDATLNITGPADVTISTWSAGFYDAAAALRFRDSGRMTSCRFIVDSSAKRGQATVADIGDLFGAENVRATRMHAKFALIRNDEWAVLITTSMNLNLNARCEQFEMTDDPVRADLFSQFAEALFSELPEGDTSDRKLPPLRDMEAVPPTAAIRATRTVRTGRWE